jgi:HD-GYP domain-containing protein (c-di-GMP phosphodiesterase class II)
MHDTEDLLGKIANLRQRLEQAQGLADAASVIVGPLDKGGGADLVRALERKVAAGSHQDAVLHRSVNQLPGIPAQPGSANTPSPHMTARARRLLPPLQEALGHLRSLSDEPLLRRSGEDDPLAVLHGEAIVMTDMAMRTLNTLPDSPNLQVRLCEGVEALLKIVQRRLSQIRVSMQQRREEQGRIDQFAELLQDLATSPVPDITPFAALADVLLREAQQSVPLRFLYTPPTDQARFVACHSLTVAQVAARLVRGDQDWRGQPQQPILAALVHDVGMLSIPGEILAHPGPFDTGQRREVEAHVRIGAQIVNRLGSAYKPLADATLSHHERLDGTGYSAGLSDLQIEPLVRVLAVADVYAAMCCPRPHRPSIETRTALTDTLLLAQQGSLDRNCARALLDLSLFPVGLAVELADGSFGVVVATHQSRKDINSCARPVVIVLTDTQGQPLPFPTHLDLAESEGRSIVRSLPPAERRQLLRERYPEWA